MKTLNDLKKGSQVFIVVVKEKVQSQFIRNVEEVRENTIVVNGNEYYKESGKCLSKEDTFASIKSYFSRK